MSNEKLDALQQLARDRYGGRVAFRGEAFIIDGIRLFLPADALRKGEPPKLLEQLTALLANEQAARKVSETQ